MAVLKRVNGDSWQLIALKTHFHGSYMLDLHAYGLKCLRVERPLQIPKIQEHALTLTHVFNFFIAWFALALSNWYHPLPIHSAVDAR